MHIGAFSFTCILRAFCVHLTCILRASCVLLAFYLRATYVLLTFYLSATYVPEFRDWGTVSPSRRLLRAVLMRTGRHETSICENRSPWDQYLWEHVATRPVPVRTCRHETSTCENRSPWDQYLWEQVAVRPVPVRTRLSDPSGMQLLSIRKCSPRRFASLNVPAVQLEE